MALEGSIQEFGLADILQLIHIQKKTGILKIAGKKDEINIYFIGGGIVDIRSNKMPAYNRLEDILLKKEVISQNDIKNLEGSKKKDDIKIFLKKGLVSREVFYAAVESLVIDTLVYLFTWKEGTYEFISKTIPRTAAVVDSPLDTQQVLMEGMRIVDELLIIEGKLDLDLVYTRSSRIDTNSLDPVEQRVYALIDGKKDVSLLINEAHMEYLETARALISLDDKHVIHTIVKPLLEKKAKKSKRLLRIKYAFSMVFILLFITLYSLRGFSNNFFDILAQRQQALEMENLRKTLDLYYLKHNYYPESLEKLEVQKDRWGNPYFYKRTPNGFTLFSSGPDGKAGTEDDVY